MALPTRTLRSGVSGSDVITLQECLNHHIPSPYGYMLSLDGDFGPATWNAVVFFQSSNYLTADGIVGPRTWRTIGELEGDTTNSGPTIGSPAPVAGPSTGSPPIGSPPPVASPGSGISNGSMPSSAPTNSPDTNDPVPNGPSRGIMRLRRTGQLGHQNGFLGELTINNKTWATVERGGNYTSVRQGTYYLTMDMKGGKNPRAGIRFDEHAAIRRVLWHDAASNSSLYLEGCISPGYLRPDGQGIIEAKRAMAEVFVALGGYTKGAKVTCVVENNAPGKGGDKDSWIRQRAQSRNLPYP